MAITSKILLSPYLQNLTFSRNIPYRDPKLFHDVQNIFSKSLPYLIFNLKININITNKKQMSMDWYAEPKFCCGLEFWHHNVSANWHLIYSLIKLLNLCFLIKWHIMLNINRGKIFLNWSLNSLEKHKINMYSMKYNYMYYIQVFQLLKPVGVFCSLLIGTGSAQKC